MKRFSTMIAITIAILLMLPVFALAQAPVDPKGTLYGVNGTDLLFYYYRNYSADKSYANNVSTINNKFKFDYSLARWAHYGELAGIPWVSNIIIPYGSKTVETRIGTASATNATSSGLGDVCGMFGMYFLKNQKFEGVFHLNVTAPTGEYRSDSTVNMGSNKWSYGPELGFAYKAIPKLLVEAYGLVYFSTENTDYGVNHSSLSTDPLFKASTNVSYDLTDKLFLAGTYYWVRGGETSRDGVKQMNDIATQAAMVTAGLKVEKIQILFQYVRDLDVKNGFQTSGIQLRALYAF